jgi:hypothetical protein
MNDICDNYAENLISKYIKFGWGKLTKIFLNSKIGKEKVLQLNKSIKLLKMLSGIREFYVDYLFNCCNDDDNTIYKSFGSTNITSDYDISILGKNAPEVMIKMFNSFLEKYNDSMSISFDTNIYCVGYFSSIDINKNITVDIGNNISIIKLNSKEDIEFALIFSFMKLSNVDFSGYELSPNITNILKKSNEFILIFRDVYDTVYEKVKLKYKKITSEDTLDIITKYKINGKVSKKLYDKLYNRISDIELKRESEKEFEKANLYELACIANYFSIESYYTCATVNVVVLEMQGKKENLKLGQIEYICSAIENLGDFLNHLENSLSDKSGVSINETLIKLSKYLHRIYYSLSKINSMFTKNTEDIENLILEKKTNINLLTEIQLNLLNYYTEQDSDITNYKKRIEKQVLDQIFDFLKFNL